MVTGTAAPALRWQLSVDWTGTDTWGVAGTDVSADVLGLRWQWGRRGLPAPEFAGPATVEITLRNHDHRYTPGVVAAGAGNGNISSGGPLGDNVRPGRPLWLRLTRSHDDFDTGSVTSVDLKGRATVGGGAWTVVGATGNGFYATAGAVRGGLAGWPPSDAVALLDAGDPRATLTARYRRGSDGLGGFALRCAARTDCLRLRFRNQETILERVSGRTAQRLAGGSPLVAGAWYDLEIEQADGGVRVTATRLGLAGASRQEILASAAPTNAPVSGRHRLWHGFRNVTDRWGPFGVGRSLFCGRITEIRPDYAAGVCHITAADVMADLAGIPLHRALSGGLMRSGPVAAAILGWAGLTAADYRLDQGRMLLTGGPRAVWNVSAARALHRLQREEHGLIYADGLGRVRLEAASVRAGVRANAKPAALATVSIADTAGGAAPYAVALRRDDGAGAVEDAVVFRYRRSADSGRQQVWSLNEALAIPAGGQQLALVETDAWDVTTDLVAPTASTDYAATDDAAGEGADVTSDITIEPVVETESGVAGRGHAVRIKNSGANPAYLQRLTLYADHCWRTQSTSAARAAASASAGSNSNGTGNGLPLPTGRERVISGRYADHYGAAQGAAEARRAERSRPRSHLEATLPLPASGAENSRAITEARLSDVVELKATAQGITGAWRWKAWSCV